MTTTNSVAEPSLGEVTQATPNEEGNESMATTTHPAKHDKMTIDQQLASSWPMLVFVFALATYACVCMIGLVVGMTAVKGF